MLSYYPIIWFNCEITSVLMCKLVFIILAVTISVFTPIAKVARQGARCSLLCPLFRRANLSSETDVDRCEVPTMFSLCLGGDIDGIVGAGSECCGSLSRCIFFR